MKILVAEDNEANREMLCLRLRRFGHDVIETLDGAQAVAMVRQCEPDIVIMDLSMPVLDGIEAWRMICDLVDSPPPVIALTAIAIADVRLICDEAGFDAYHTKPVDFPKLIAAIESLAMRSRPLAV